MFFDCYRFPTAKGLVSIRPSPKVADEFELWLNRMRICDGFSSADEAAFHAKNHDFENDLQKDAFAYISVSDDLNRWTKCDRQEIEEHLDRLLPQENQHRADRKSSGRACRSDFTGAGGSPRDN